VFRCPGSIPRFQARLWGFQVAGQVAPGLQAQAGSQALGSRPPGSVSDSGSRARLCVSRLLVVPGPGSRVQVPDQAPGPSSSVSMPGVCSRVAGCVAVCLQGCGSSTASVLCVVLCARAVSFLCALCFSKVCVSRQFLCFCARVSKASFCAKVKRF
jgi:hypothetical protein